MLGREAPMRARTRDAKEGAVAPWRDVRKSRERVVRLDLTVLGAQPG